MRNLSSYEKQQFYDQHNRFEPPAFLSYGDELGEYYDTLCRCEDYAATYGDPAFALAIQMEIIDTHYACLTDAVESPDIHGIKDFPSPERIAEKYREFGMNPLGFMKALDWGHTVACMWAGTNKWRD